MLQENHYYPLGMGIGDLAIDRGADNKYLYNGKELQEDVFNGVAFDWYDYGFRFPDEEGFSENQFLVNGIIALFKKGEEVKKEDETEQ